MPLKFGYVSQRARDWTQQKKPTTAAESQELIEQMNST